MTEDEPSPTEDIRVLGGNPSPAEMAAITAVLTAALEEIVGEHRRRRSRGPTAWQRSQHRVRRPLTRGAWRTFGE